MLSTQCCLVPPLIWKLLFVCKVEIVKLAFHFFTDPPCSSSVIFDTFCKYLEPLNTAQYSNFNLLGDFNVNFVNSSHPFKLCNIMSTYCLTQIVAECTQHIYN